jgi:hypothetical protein
MSADSKPAEAGFLGRWSRRKVEARENPRGELEEASPELPVAHEPPALPAIDELTLDSDFRGFLHPEVHEDVRRAALRKLFSDPHFNVMDGLDVYIDDYSKTEPISPEMLAGLRQAQRILDWAEGKDDIPEDVAAPADGAAPATSLAEPRAADAVLTRVESATGEPADAAPAQNETFSRAAE